MNNISERARLLQKELPERLVPSKPQTFITVFELGDLPDDITIFCALIPDSELVKTLANDDWELQFGHGQPYFEHDGTRVSSYQRISDHGGVEPFIHYRDYHNRWRSLPEVSEEFRLFHNLYQNPDGELWMVNHNYEEVLVGKVQERKVNVQLGLIRQYLAVRGMHLAIYYASHQRSDVPLSDLGFEEEYRDSEFDGRSRSHIVVPDGWDMGVASFSRKVGKILIPPYAQDHNSIRYFYNGPPKTYEEFIIEVDEHGREIRFTCNDDRLANYFGANPGAPNYMTKVLFRSTVLDRYHGEPSRFTVEGGYVRCKGLWGHRMDNHSNHGVYCALGDLGLLPQQEQAHWKSHNIPPYGDWSETTKRMWFDAEFADSERPEDLFAAAYQNLVETSTRVLGWPMLRPLHEDDQHYFGNVRVPTKNEQVEFDGVIASLSKVVIESLDLKNLRKLLPSEYTNTLSSDALSGSINVLDHGLRYHILEGAEEHIRTLRDLQNYRSKGPAHLRGADWRQALDRLNPEGLSLRDVAVFQIAKVVAVLVFLSTWVEKINPSSSSDPLISNLSR